MTADHPCRQHLKDRAAANGIDVHVSTLPPIVASPYGVEAYVCPHDITYWIEPTGEQIAQWVREDTP